MLVLIIFWITTCQGCRGGRSLGEGSAGTVIIPQTPQQINERNTPTLEPLPPPPIIQTNLEPIAPVTEAPASTNTPASSSATPVKPIPQAPVKSTPTTPMTSIKANPVVVNPKPAGELKPFSPTISDTTTLITPPMKNLPTDNKATAEANDFPLCDPMETAETKSFNWIELLLNYLLFIIIAIFIWTIYDIIRRRGDSKVNRLTNNPKLKKGRTKKKKKAIRTK